MSGFKPLLTLIIWHCYYALVMRPRFNGALPQKHLDLDATDVLLSGNCIVKSNKQAEPLARLLILETKSSFSGA
ncbi:hypothetical protein MBAV_001221 [Candidatus Magnetobacterium bavaricum]|uniref:Uncharacterized protein n=1 Tax=Candidatus Magnetobacterium bavaricum TaxID=29290 RepID=A0A0F3GXF9_9BACT|nr:hypothetical protein MBAV_001221 [Candidatus Magnetobacterium bavaricum]